MKILDMCSNKEIRPQIDVCFYFSEIKEAFEYMANRKNKGKVIIIPNKKK